MLPTVMKQNWFNIPLSMLTHSEPHKMICRKDISFTDVNCSIVQRSPSKKGLFTVTD